MADELRNPVPLMSAIGRRSGAAGAILGGAMLLAVWLFLWSWLTVGVAAPLSRLPYEPPAISGT